MALAEILVTEAAQRILLGGALVAGAAALVGVFIVLRGESLLGDSLAHASFAGIGLGLLLGVAPFYLALASAVVAGLVIHVLEHRGITHGDAALGIVLAGGLGIGVLLAAASGAFDEELLETFFGSLEAVTWDDVATLALLLAVLVVVVVGLFKEYLYLTFDEETARASGLPTHALNVLFSVLTAMAVVAAIKIVGVLLVSALLVAPAAASHHVSRSFRQALALAVVLALASMVGGVLLAFEAAWPPGGAVAVTSLVIFGAVVGGRRMAEILGG